MTMRLVSDRGPALAELIRHRVVMRVGRLASMTNEQFQHIVEEHGGHYRYSDVHLDRGSVALVVIGQLQWPLGRFGGLPQRLRRARVVQERYHSDLTIVSERQFLEELGLQSYLDNFPGLYTAATLCDLLHLSRQRLRAWVKGGLIQPARTDRGVWYFDFQQVSAANTLWDLVQRGVNPGRLRRMLNQLSAWVPDAQQAVSQLAILQRNGELLVRLERGELAEAGGQFHFDFDAELQAPPLRISTGPSTASEWHHQAVEQEQAGFLAEAVESYREALVAGGPNPRICFDLAHLLAEMGEKHLAMERYRFAVEIDPKFADAWNNLGLLLVEFDHRDEACSCFRRALAAQPGHPMACYNLADTLDELGRFAEAAPHWQTYLRQDTASPWAAYARRRVAAG